LPNIGLMAVLEKFNDADISFPFQIGKGEYNPAFDVDTFIYSVHMQYQYLCPALTDLLETLKAQGGRWDEMGRVLNTSNVQPEDVLRWLQRTQREFSQIPTDPVNIINELHFIPQIGKYLENSSPIYFSKSLDFKNPEDYHEVKLTHNEKWALFVSKFPSTGDSNVAAAQVSSSATDNFIERQTSVAENLKSFGTELLNQLFSLSK